MDMKDILQKVASGALRPEEAEALLRKNPADRPYEEMGFAKLDTDRKARSGFAEVVYCQGKSDAFIGQIFKKLYETEGEVFGTRASPHQYELVKKVLPSISYDPISHILKQERRRNISDALRSAPAALPIYRWRKKRPRRQNTSAAMWNGFMT